jgi:hypothetical protein
MMSKKKDYDVGYGKPPRHSQFLPGVSGFKGRKKKVLETQAEIVARIRDEQHLVDGKLLTMYEIMMRAAMHRALSGKPSDVKTVLEMFSKFGAQPEAEEAIKMEAAAEAAMAKVGAALNRAMNLDPEDLKANAIAGREEALLVMGCAKCGPALRARWGDPASKARYNKNLWTALRSQVDDLKKGPPK